MKNLILGVLLCVFISTFTSCSSDQTDFADESVNVNNNDNLSHTTSNYKRLLRNAQYWGRYTRYKTNAYEFFANRVEAGTSSLFNTYSGKKSETTYSLYFPRRGNSMKLKIGRSVGTIEFIHARKFKWKGVNYYRRNK